MMQDYFKLALKNLGKRKVRSWLTILGIVISVAIIFVLISLSVGLRDAVNQQFEILGSDKFFIMPKGQAGAPGAGGAVELTTHDVDIIKGVSGVRDITGITAGNAEVEFEKQTKYFMVVGIPLDQLKLYTESTNIKMIDGRALKEDDKGKVIIGYDFEFSAVFDKPVKPGDDFLINNKSFTVIGIVDRIGNPQDDKNIIMPIDDFSALFNSGNRVDQIVVRVQSGEDIKAVANRVSARLTKSRGLTEKTKDFTITTPEELLSSFGIILNVITAFLVGVASISLLVGSIGIANTMYTSVLERTREIGTMKAVGARNSDILFIFLIESGLIGLVGGIIGVVLGFGIAKSVEYVGVESLNTTLLRAAVPWYLVLGCLVFAFLIGSLAGVFPASRASKLKPVDALRYE
jgi:putative ABC transport system permease protein